MEARKDSVKPFDLDELFQSTMKKKWNEVLSAYRDYPDARKAKLTKSEDTALHIAVSSYRADLKDAPKLVEWVTQLVDTIPKKEAYGILGMSNDKGNTPLHFAAALGSEKICSCIASKDHRLLEKRNKRNETPFFWAANHGKLQAFRLLCHVWKEKQKEVLIEPLFRRDDGCNILHAAIRGEYFELASHIILNYEKLVDSKTVEGLSPLYILATKPNVFPSSSNLRLCARIIYNCLIVSKLQEKADTEPKKNNTEPKKNYCSWTINEEYPDNYETCVNFIQKSWSVFKKIIVAPIGSQNDKHHKKDEESQEENKYEGAFPPNYSTCIRLLKFAMNLMLILLGIGVTRIMKIREKKEKHTWAKQIMDKLMEKGKHYKYGHDGQSPANILEPRYAADAAILFPPPAKPSDSDEEAEEENGVVVSAKMKKSLTKEKLRSVEPDENQDQTKEELHSVQPDENQDPTKEELHSVQPDANQDVTLNTEETPILVAAKMGITEMVDKILETFPVAIQDVDKHEKNALLLAIENRQTKVFDLLIKKKFPEFVLYQLDDKGNSALHLAATFQKHQPWRIPGAALQLQWEIKWFKHVKHTMPAQCLVQFRENKEGQTAKQLFTSTHENLVKEGSDWLLKTSESCSVVAALIATVAFATSTAVPGGIKETTGDPVLEGQLAFDIFSLASLVALCFSVTSLVFFLAILTSRCQEQDFKQDLPQKLLLGLSTLFASIAGILLSFCAGHFFVLKNELHNAAFFIYAITCLPISFFAFAQLPLYFDLIWSTSRKIPLRCYKVVSQ